MNFKLISLKTDKLVQSSSTGGPIGPREIFFSSWWRGQVSLAFCNWTFIFGSTPALLFNTTICLSQYFYIILKFSTLFNKTPQRGNVGPHFINSVFIIRENSDRKKNTWETLRIQLATTNPIFIGCCTVVKAMVDENAFD